MRRKLGLTWATFVVAATCGCLSAQRVRPYHTVLPTVVRTAQAARQANEGGLSHATAGDYTAAETAFRRALAADPSCAAAHNNLGLALLKKRRVYEAALEFSFAAKLDRRATEPVVNLARLYERVGWYKAAAGEYEKALELAPGNSEIMGRLAHSYARCGVDAQKMERLLRALAGNGSSGDWGEWALARLEMGSGQPSP